MYRYESIRRYISILDNILTGFNSEKSLMIEKINLENIQDKANEEIKELLKEIDKLNEQGQNYI